MRITWLEPVEIQRARDALAAQRPMAATGAAAWEMCFSPAFAAPPAPTDADPARWPRVVEHVARAERVSAAVREGGLDRALTAFGDSVYAVELATLVAAAAIVDRIELSLVEAVLGAPIDEFVIYGPFLELLGLLGLHGGDQPGRALATYERFAAAYAAVDSAEPMWRDRVGAVRDGLAGFYVTCGRERAAHALFLDRHDEERGDLMVALSASRSFLGAGMVGRAVQWLGIGVERAEALGRGAMATRLRAKRDALRRRQS